MAEEGEESQNKRESEEEEEETKTLPRAQSDLTDGEKTGL